MKKFLLSALTLFVATLAMAQSGTCTPNPTFEDSLAGVYPLPYDIALSPEGGIPVKACINKPFEFVFNIRVTDSITTNNISVGIDTIVLDPLSAISGLPAGITYACNPPSCRFLKNTIGCAVLYGTASAANAPGNYSLTITGKVYTFNGLIAIPITFPGSQFPGSYTLGLEAETSTNCFVVSGNEDIEGVNFAMDNQPNPFGGITNIHVVARDNMRQPFRVFDATGNEIFQQVINFTAGDNYFDFDAATLPNGMYFYTLGQGTQLLSRKMIVVH